MAGLFGPSKITRTTTMLPVTGRKPEGTLLEAASPTCGHPLPGGWFCVSMFPGSSDCSRAQNEERSS
jgi:hypothetical protein